MAKGRMKVKVLGIEDYDADSLEEALNEELKKLKDYYIVDIKELGVFIAIMYLSEKKSKFTDEEE
jgi:hypothetical protein